MWMSQISRNLTRADDGVLTGKRFLIHDRDPRFTLAFRETLAAADVQVVRLPRSHQISMPVPSASFEPSRSHVWTGSSWWERRRSDERCGNS